MSSATEAEMAALFYNGKDAAPFRIALTEMGHPQKATLILADNACAAGIANSTVKQRRFKAMEDMRFYWIKDRVLKTENVGESSPCSPLVLPAHNARPGIALTVLPAFGAVKGKNECLSDQTLPSKSVPSKRNLTWAEIASK
jgi:hypothetical protein